MSSRALRKAQREKEEQDRVKQLKLDARALDPNEEDDEDDLPVKPQKKSAFAILLEEDDDELDETEDPEDDDSIAAEMPAAATAPKTSCKKKKKKKKKGRGKEELFVGDSGNKDSGLDEIDIALKQLSATGSDSQIATTEGSVDQAVDEASKLLAIDTSYLHAENEMRRLFGRTALQQDEEEGEGGEEQPRQATMGRDRRQQRRMQREGWEQALRGRDQGGQSGGLFAMAMRRNIFVQGKENWPAATGGGLGMGIEEKRADGTTVYRYLHNSAYRDVQSHFESFVDSMDHTRLIALLRLHPYHISTLLQVSEIARYEGDRTTAGDLLERALFSFGRAAHSAFGKSLSEGKARLDFRRAENREFWLASWRYMQNLAMRGTWRTVYEWAKLLLSLSPEEDPYALWLVLDQYALRARQDLHYLYLSRNPIFKQVHLDRPNVQISQGLAEYRSVNRNKGKQALFTAVGKYPWLIERLMRELNLDPPTEIWGKQPRTARENLYAELYATSAKDVWNTPESSSLLIEVASALPPGIADGPIDYEDISREEARHVLICDAQSLIARLPRTFLAQVRLGSSSDPLPPEEIPPVE